MIYSFSFWMLLRQQLIEKQEEQQLKEDSLHEVKSTSTYTVLYTPLHTNYT